MTTERPPASAMRAAFLVDHRELAPEILRRRSPPPPRRSPAARPGARKTLTMSTGTGTSARLLEALLAEDLRLARVDRNDAVAVTLAGRSRRSSWRAADCSTARRWRSSSRCGARAGSSADPDSRPDRMASSRGHLGRGRRGHAGEALLEIPDQVVDRLDADREPDGARADAGGPQLVLAQLTVRRAGRMDDEALRSRRRWRGATTTSRRG